MKGALIALLIGIVLLILLYLRIEMRSSRGTIDIHLHDTYFVLSYASVVVFLLLFLGTFFALGGIIGSHFKSKVFWTLVVLFLSIDTYYVVSFYKSFNEAETTALPKE
jgi:hypothetical protein